MKRRALLPFLVCLAGALALSSLGQPSYRPAGIAPSGMVLVPAGRYIPLFRAEKDPKEIQVRSFFLDVLPVTNSDFLEFVRANPKWRRSAVKRLFADGDYLQRWTADLILGTNAAASAPVTHVSWFAAKAYGGWKGKRLPLTAEWEYAAGASSTQSDGANDPEFIREVRAWYVTPAPETLPLVGRSRPNFFGVHDLHGLIWEWVADFSTAMVTGDARGDTGLDRQLFCGAGSEGAKDTSNFPAFMRDGFRSSLKASYTVHNLGFRCARSFAEDQK